jgi:hypothetical protein
VKGQKEELWKKLRFRKRRGNPGKTDVDRLGYKMTCIKWKYLRKKNNKRRVVIHHQVIVAIF